MQENENFIERVLAKKADLLTQWEREMLSELKEQKTVAELSERLGISKQLCLYRLKKMEKRGIVERAGMKITGSAVSTAWKAVSEAFYDGSPQEGRERAGLPGRVMAVIGSPDPHGPEMARSRDMLHALLLGSAMSQHLSNRIEAVYDTMFSESENANLFVLGGPVVNSISARLEKRMKVKLSRGKKPGIGVIETIKSPFHRGKIVVRIAGYDYHGTGAAVLALSSLFWELMRPGYIIVKAYDRDMDGMVDDYGIVERGKG